MEFNFKQGIRLIVELSNNQLYEGDCQKCAKNRIDLINVVSYPSGKILKGLLSYYTCEILSVRVLEHHDSGNQSDTSTSTTSDYDSPIKNGLGKVHHVIGIAKNEYERLLKMTQTYIYMATLDNRYVNAVEHLNNCETIGVFGIGSKSGRMNPLNLLVLCSWDQVYIFDLFLFRKKTFEPELKEILESDKIKKVVHDSRKLVDCLWHCHKVKLNNIFDTAVAELVLEKKQTEKTPDTIRSLSESLEHFLNFPSSLLESALEVTTAEWQERAVLPSRKVMAAQLVVFLITLKEKQENLLLKEYYKTVKLFSDLSVNADSYTIQTTLDDEKTVPETIKEYL